MISVITISWNAEKEIVETVKSILNQDKVKFEFIVIDGASNDQTVATVWQLINESKFHPEHFEIISEPDNGVFDAMNKGVKLAKGDYVIFMNCGDRFYDNYVLMAFENAIARGEDADVYYGNTLMVFYEGKGFFHDDETSIRNPIMPFIHQSAITRRNILLKHPFNLNYRICADFELYHWMRNNGYRFNHENFTVSIYDAREGLSEKNPLLIRREKDRVIGRNKEKNYWLTKIIQCLTIGMIQPIKDYAPRKLLNYYFRQKKTYINWIE